MKMNKRFGAFLLVILMLMMAMVGCADIEKGEIDWKPSGKDPAIESQPTAAPEKVVTFGAYPSAAADSAVSGILKTYVRIDPDTGVWTEYENTTEKETETGMETKTIVARYDLQTGFYNYKETVNGAVTVEKQYVLENGKYFAVEPISWIILEEKADSYVLIARDILEAGIPFLETYGVSTWADSSIRDWLNGTDAYAKGGTAYSEKWNFINRAFTNAQIAMIKTSTLNTKDNEAYGIAGGGETKDQIYLLSAEEVAAYFGESLTAQCVGTPYALHKGLSATKDQGIWWLRSPGYNTSFQGVDRNGDVTSYGSADAQVGVRPVICVSKQAIS